MEEIAGVATTEPAFGLPAYWIQEGQRDRAQLLGYTVVDGATGGRQNPSEIRDALTGELFRQG
jgi:hypothetical protein